MLEEVAVQCPHCGETITLALDLSEGDQSYVEDCSVCCEPNCQMPNPVPLR